MLIGSRWTKLEILIPIVKHSGVNMSTGRSIKDNDCERGARGRRCAGLDRFSAARHGEQMQVMSSFAASSQQHAVQCRRPSTKKWCESGRYQRQSRGQQQDEDQLAKAGFIQMSIES